jgi:hypothetical protein
MLTTHKKLEEHNRFGSILMLRAWGLGIVIASLILLYAGHLLDKLMGTAPNFMLGLLFLAVFISIARLYKEAWLKLKDV